MSPESYLQLVIARLLSDANLDGYSIIREQITDNNGQFRIRVTFLDSSWLEFSEYFRKSEKDEIDVIAYSYHWMGQDNKLLVRWDNAKHYPRLRGFPHHVHDGDENNVLPGEPMDLFKVLDFIAARLKPSS
jgi:hypothetical protein